MNYKEILTEEAVEQFKKEGAAYTLIILFKQRLGIYDKRIEEDLKIREIEVQLEENKCVAIAGRTPAAEAAIAKYYVGDMIGEEKWFYFHLVHRIKDVDKLLTRVAIGVGLNPTDLKWMFVNDR